MATTLSSKLTAIAKNPGAYVLLLLGIWVGALLRGDGKDGTRAGDAKEREMYWQQLYRETDSAYKATLRELAITKGALREMPNLADSVIQPPPFKK